MNWIEKHIWTNLFHGKPIVEEHFLKYNLSVSNFDNVKDYYLQNKMLTDLGFLGIKQMISN